MALEAPRTGQDGRGHAKPRIAPPEPAVSLLGPFEEACVELGIELFPWQRNAARYLTATGPDGTWLYRRAAVVVARQNGKTTLLDPLIWSRLKMGRRIVHSAQNRYIPEQTFYRLVAALDGKPGIKIRRGRGSEQITYGKTGMYRVVAPRGGVRGISADDVILDEARAQEDYEFIGDIEPTLVASPNPQTIYSSNAGTENSVVLNDLREARDTDPRLCYLEWSAEPHLAIDDPLAWAQSNPALGYTITADTLGDLARTVPPQIFETEHLCRWVTTLRPSLVDVRRWIEGRTRQPIPAPVRPYMGIAVDGNRASAVLAWQSSGDLVVKVLADVRGNPLDLVAFGKDLRNVAIRAGVQATGFAPWTDAGLALYLPATKPMTVRHYANASEAFVRAVETLRIKWFEADEITEDLTWAARDQHDSGAWTAVKAKDDVPITAVLAAIRAVWLASGPKALAPRIM